MGLSDSPPAYDYQNRQYHSPSSLRSKAFDTGLYITTDPELADSYYADGLGKVLQGAGKRNGVSKNPENGDKEVSKSERYLGPLVYILPVLTAIALLFAATCSANGWRVKVNVLRVDLPNDVFARLLATGKNLGKSGTGDAATTGTGKAGKTTEGETGGLLEGRAGKVVAAGYLSVGFWGWCVSRPDNSE